MKGGGYPMDTHRVSHMEKNHHGAFQKMECLCMETLFFWNVVTTLALNLQPRQRLTRVWAKNKVESHISCSRECKKLWGNEPSHSQVSSYFGSWTLNRFSNFQKMITGVKTHWIEAFHISLESSWNVNVWNGSYDLVGHLKHKLWSKEGSGIVLISLCAGGVRHIVEKLSTRDIILLQTSYWSEVWKQNYGPPKSCEFQLWEFRDSQLGVLGQNAIWMLVLEPAIEYTIRGKVVVSPKSEPWWVLWVRVCPWHILARKVIQLCINWLIVWFVQVRVNDWVLVILLSLILELQHALLPAKFYEPRNVHPTPCSFVVLTSDSHLSLLRSLGACQMPCWILCFVRILSPKKKGMMIFDENLKHFEYKFNKIC
jgi:hypothetical protein